MASWIGAEDGRYRFAVELGEGGVRLTVTLATTPPAPRPPALRVAPAARGTTLVVRPAATPGQFWVTVGVPDPAPGAEEDELVLTLRSRDAAVPPAVLLLRRTRCRVSAGLVQREAESAALQPATRAALLWHAWRRYAELLGLKRFTAGTSDSDVLVFRPRLRPPATDDPALVGPAPGEVTAAAWGAPLLVKTGATAAVQDEWRRFQLFLADRLHPFMARLEACLTVHSPGPDAADGARATLIGPFIGGEVLQAETLESMLRGPAGADAVAAVVPRLFAVTGTWYASGAEARLGHWWKMLRPASTRGGAARPRAPLVLFGRYDLTADAARRRLGAGLAWADEFASAAHLAGHLIGPAGDGLLPRLAALPVRYSLVHGDLHVRNVLVAPDHVSLLDFGGTAIAPTVFDFARLEVFVRLWGLSLAPPDPDVAPHVTRIETQLLDHFTATEGGLPPVRALAGALGVAPEALLTITRCVATIRRAALPYCLDAPDRRDYLAVLYLTVFHALRFAGRGGPEPVANFRWLMALYWVLEDALSRVVGLAPFRRRAASLRPEGWLDPAWLLAPGAPGRVRYWLDRPEGRRALGPLEATRGVLQGSAHPLDVLDETLLALGYLEAILDDPVRALAEPEALAARVRAALAADGLRLPAGPDGPAAGGAPARRAAGPEALRATLAARLDPPARLALKWATLLQHVGRPATRVQTATPDGPRVAFPGAERHGRALAAAHLAALFPDAAVRTVAEQLVAAQPAHGPWLRRALAPARRRALARAAVDGTGAGALLAEVAALAGSVDLVPLWALQGYAATLAAGTGAPPPAAVAALETALLQIHARAGRRRARGGAPGPRGRPAARGTDRLPPSGRAAPRAARERRRRRRRGRS